MNDSHGELSLALLTIARDLEHTLACIGDFDLRYGFTSSHGQATAKERALGYDVEHARAQARALVSALADVNDLNLDHVSTLVMDLGRTIDNAFASAPASDFVNSLERARGFASTINSAIVNDLARLTSGCGDTSNTHTADESLEKINRPPVYVEKFLGWLASLDESVQGDFQERHQRLKKKHGVHLAQLHYCGLVLRSVPGFLRIRFRRAPRK